jgi:hypothetical protein
MTNDELGKTSCLASVLAAALFAVTMNAGAARSAPENRSNITPVRTPDVVLANPELERRLASRKVGAVKTPAPGRYRESLSAGLNQTRVARCAGYNRRMGLANSVDF